MDFDIDDSPEYHRTYRLRDKKGNDFTDMLEVHIIELRKKLGGGEMDDWIRLFNAKNEEDLDMIKTNNPGILEAIREVRIMGLGRTLRAVYEMKMKEIRDQKARDAYVLDEGIAIGEERGITLGETRKLVSQVKKKVLQNQSAEEIAGLLEEELSFILRIYNIIKAHPEWDEGKICQELEKK